MKMSTGAMPLGDSFLPGGRGGAKQAYLLVFTGVEEKVNVVKLNRNMTIGREVPNSKPDISVNSPIMSRTHGEFTTDGENFYYQDTGSFNGTFINGVFYNEMVNPCLEPIKLNDGDVIRFDNMDANKSHKNAVAIIFSTGFDKRSKWRRAKVTGSKGTIGISEDNLVEFDVEKINFRCAEAMPADTGCDIRCFPYSNNVKYRNKLVSGNFRLRNKDAFCIDRSYVFYDNNEFIYSVCLATSPGLDVNISQTYVKNMFKKLVLLKNISLSVDKGDFALIIGGSGAGKSTFINSILGKLDIEGTVSIEGQISDSTNNLTSKIAYVPQHLTLRKDEELLKVVTDTYNVRGQRKCTDEERDKFIMETLDSVGLSGKVNMQIKNLSGGEQKRAAIASEAVTDANIFFLDEPDSGLDPKSGFELMHNLKNLSDKGKIVLLISHNYASYPSPESLYTKIIILAKSNVDKIGTLAFCGSVTEALEFFGVKELKDITRLINPVSENGEGRADEFVEKFRRMNGNA